MWRIYLIVALLLTMATAKAQSETEAFPSRSRIMVEILQRYGGPYEEFCLVQLEVSKKFKYRRVPLPSSFYERFVTGQLDDIKFNPPGCPTMAGDEDACLPSCGLLTIFDMSALGYQTLWSPWPDCEPERISFLRSHDRPQGKIVLILNVHREFEVHHHLTVIEIAHCDYLVYSDIVME